MEREESKDQVLRIAKMKIQSIKAGLIVDNDVNGKLVISMKEIFFRYISIADSAFHKSEKEFLETIIIIWSNFFEIVGKNEDIASFNIQLNTLCRLINEAINVLDYKQCYLIAKGEMTNYGIWNYSV